MQDWTDAVIQALEATDTEASVAYRQRSDAANVTFSTRCEIITEILLCCVVILAVHMSFNAFLCFFNVLYLGLLKGPGLRHTDQ